MNFQTQRLSLNLITQSKNLWFATQLANVGRGRSFVVNDAETPYACVIYVCLLVSKCKTERSFSMLRRIHTYVRNKQTQERLNHIGVLSTHRDIARTMGLRTSMHEFAIQQHQDETCLALPVAYILYEFLYYNVFKIFNFEEYIRICRINILPGQI